MPGVKRGHETPPKDPLKENSGTGGGGDDGFGELDLLIRGLIQKLPVSGSVWPGEDRQKWFALAEGIFGVVYNDKAKDVDLGEPNQIQ